MNTISGQTVVVAGGAGFIGRHLAAKLMSHGAQVHIVDNLATSSGATGLPGEFHLLDVANTRSFPEADLIFNLASPASPTHYQADPIQTWKSNTIGTLNLLDHAISCGARFVQASTSEVYGDPLTHPQKETDWGNVNPIGPRACYDESKRAAESLLMDAFRAKRVDVRIARIFNTYGPGMTQGDGRVVPNFIQQALSNQPITVYGDGKQTRSLCYVSDTVEALIKLATVDACAGEVVNIGNPDELTILQLAQKIISLTKTASLIVHASLPMDDPVRRCPDIAKAVAIMDWTPKVGIDAGLLTLIEESVKSDTLAAS